METYSVRIDPRGRGTIPPDVLRALDVRPGDQVDFTIDDETITVKKNVPMILDEMVGSIPPLAEPMDVEEMIRIAKEDRAEELVRKLRDEW